MVLFHHLQNEVLLGFAEDGVGEVRQVVESLLKDEVLRSACEWRVASLQEVEHSCQRVHVADLFGCLIVDALWSHVVGCSDIVLKDLPPSQPIS